MRTYIVLSIDAWRYDSGWYWNAWYSAGAIELSEAEINNNRAVLRVMRETGRLSEESKGKVRVEDDGYNLVICARNTGEPIFAIEYGSHW